MSGCLVIIERELLALLRSRRTLWIFVSVAVVFSTIVFLKWPSTGIVDLNGNKGRELFQWLSYSMLAASILIVPIFPATSLVTEVRRRTLELLLNSPLSRASIYFGKAFAMFGLVLLLRNPILVVHCFDSLTRQTPVFLCWSRALCCQPRYHTWRRVAQLVRSGEPCL